MQFVPGWHTVYISRQSVPPPIGCTSLIWPLGIALGAAGAALTALFALLTAGGVAEGVDRVGLARLPASRPGSKPTSCR